MPACSRAKRARTSSASACAPSTTGRPDVAAYRSARCGCCASCASATSARSATTGPAGRSTGWACTIRPAAPTASTPCGRGGSPASRPSSGAGGGLPWRHPESPPLPLVCGRRPVLRKPGQVNRTCSGDSASTSVPPEADKQPSLYACALQVLSIGRFAAICRIRVHRVALIAFREIDGKLVITHLLIEP